AHGAAASMSKNTAPVSRTVRSKSESVSELTSSALARRALSRFAEERVAPVARRHERLLDRARADPAQQIEDRARLVVGARRARAAKRLLADDGAGRLVVDVEVAGGEAQRFERLAHGDAVVRENGSRQSVFRRRVRELERLDVLRVVVDVDREHRA